MRKRLLIGLPDGRHLRESTWNILTHAGICISEYHPKGPSRKYCTSFELPSGEMCDVVMDKPKDLVYALAQGLIDLMITGDDYVEEFELFTRSAPHGVLPWRSGAIESAHVSLEHLGFYGTQLAFMVRADNPFSGLEELIRDEDKVVCYTEFPMIASAHLAQMASYKSKYGDRRPFMIVPSSVGGENENVMVIYSHGRTESKAARHSGTLILDLVLTGDTAIQNNLRPLQLVGGPIYNLMYRRADLKEKAQAADQFVSLIERTVRESPAAWRGSRP